MLLYQLKYFKKCIIFYVYLAYVSLSNIKLAFLNCYFL